MLVSTLCLDLMLVFGRVVKSDGAGLYSVP